MTLSLTSMREQLLDRLDYHKIRECMILLGWKYWGMQRSPTVEELRETAGSMLDVVMKSDKPSAGCSTGGFFAIKWTWDDVVVYQVLFALEDVSSNELPS